LDVYECALAVEAMEGDTDNGVFKLFGPCPVQSRSSSWPAKTTYIKVSIGLEVAQAVPGRAKADRRMTSRSTARFEQQKRHYLAKLARDKSFTRPTLANRGILRDLTGFLFMVMFGPNIRKGIETWSAWEILGASDAVYPAETPCLQPRCSIRRSPTMFCTCSYEYPCSGLALSLLEMSSLS
jgi:hypothetical protein